MAGILGVDVGGTFTDFLLWEDGALRVHKRPSTPDDPARGVLLGMGEMAARPRDLVHGSTVATNAVLERKGARTALFTTAGFRDVLAIGRQARPALYDLQPTRPEPLVPTALRFELAERVAADGSVLQPLDPAEVEKALDGALAGGAESLAISLLFAFLRPEHEQQAAAAARARGLFVSASHEVLPEYREYERTSTTVVNAYVSPLMARYLDRLAESARGRGVRRLRIMGSDGGSLTPATAGRLAARTVLSGPAGGVAGAFAVAQAAGFEQVITFDMGGTSTDVALCPGRVLTRDEADIGGLAVRTAMADVHTVGAGGGSLARIDAGGALHVGPESAGAEPGPACYGRGELPAVSDAQAALGRLRPDQPLAGALPLYPERARAALATLAGFASVEEAAVAVIQVANANMDRAIRVVSVARGHDPRDFTLVAFGGAGPLHACDLAASLGIPRVLVPRHPGVLSALGMALAPVTRDALAPLLRPVDDDGFFAQLRPAIARLTEEARSALRDDGYPLRGAVAEATLSLRYAGQSFELPLTLPAGRAAPRTAAALREVFHEAHGRRYGHADRARAVEAVSLRLRVALPPPPISLTPSFAEGPARLGSASVWFDRPRRTTLYRRDALRPGDRLTGPAIITQVDATTVLPHGWRGEVDAAANLLFDQG